MALLFPSLHSKQLVKLCGVEVDFKLCVEVDFDEDEIAGHEGI
jgi:hypothetical protein